MIPAFLAVGTVLGLVLAGAVGYIRHLKDEDIVMSQWREVEGWEYARTKPIRLFDQDAEEEVDPKEVEQAIVQLKVMLKEMQR